MADGNTAARYWNIPRLLIALALIATVTGATYYGWQQRADPLGRRVFAGPPPALTFNDDNLQIPKENIRHGGPPKDGIPSLTHPTMLPVDQVTYLQEDDRVVTVVVADEARAYPVRILNYHECVNDTIAGQAIAVIYCPLCDSFSVVNRTLGEKTFEFGISGLLANSNVLLYDRTDDALWSQVRLTAVSGPHAGQSLEHLDNWRIEPFSQFKARHPTGQVMSQDTGQRRNYARSPYASYFNNDALMFPVELSDKRMLNKTPVIGVRFAEGRTVAYPVTSISGELRDGDLRLAHDPATGSVHIAEVPDGAAAIYTFWFAWYAYHPETEVFGE